LEEEEIADVDEVFLEPPEGDDSDGYDDSDTEEDQSVKISRTSLCWRICLPSQSSRTLMNLS
jgi:hypothetical protein